MNPDIKTPVYDWGQFLGYRRAWIPWSVYVFLWQFYWFRETPIKWLLIRRVRKR